MRAAIIFPAEVLALVDLWESLADFVFVAGWALAPNPKRERALVGTGSKTRSSSSQEALARDIPNESTSGPGGSAQPSGSPSSFPWPPSRSSFSRT
jgi:hypothetical protein